MNESTTQNYNTSTQYQVHNSFLNVNSFLWITHNKNLAEQKTTKN